MMVSSLRFRPSSEPLRTVTLVDSTTRTFCARVSTIRLLLARSGSLVVTFSNLMTAVYCTVSSIRERYGNPRGRPNSHAE
jgi:hypothetical protein